MFNEQFTYLTRTVFGKPTFLICILDSSDDFEFCISVGTLSHSFRPIENAVSMPSFQYTVCHAYIEIDSFRL